MRHFPFPIGKEEAEEWMRCMTMAIDNEALSTELAEFLISRLEPLAEHMINKKD